MKRKLNENDVPEAVDDASKKSANISKPTFASLGLDPRLLQAVNKEKFAAPTPVQTKAIPLVLEGSNVLARAKTGSGKTLAYLLPILHSILRRKALSSTSSYTESTSALILVPTKELAVQFTAALKTFTAFCASDIRGENITRKEDAAVTRSRLTSIPDVVITTPSRACQWVNSSDLDLGLLQHLVIDEADLVLSYGYEDDLRHLSSTLPSGIQTIMMSATLRTEADTLTSLFCKDSRPSILDLSAEEAAEKPTLAHYVVRTAEEDKFLLIYTIFKLQLIKGKVIVFVADIDRCYRVKLFLEQFGIRACVLNSELPANSRLHVVEEFNRAVYDIIIAADDGEVVEVGSRKKRKLQQEDEGEHEQGEERSAENGETAERAAGQRKSSRRKQDPEYGISRGIDFRHVTCVLNFDLPPTSKSYIHRTGRTARAGQTGMALSFYVPAELYRKHKPTSIPQCKHDEDVLTSIKSRVEEGGAKVEDWTFDMRKLEPFRYRFTDALRSVTRLAVRESRTRELRQELINSARLQQHFEENPDELRHLRHDGEISARAGMRARPHLRHVPGYLLPEGGKAAVVDVGSVGMGREKVDRGRKGRGFDRGGRKGRVQKGRGRGVDPLRSLNVRGRGKK